MITYLEKYNNLDTKKNEYANIYNIILHYISSTFKLFSQYARRSNIGYNTIKYYHVITLHYSTRTYTLYTYYVILIIVSHQVSVPSPGSLLFWKPRGLRWSS